MAKGILWIVIEDLFQALFPNLPKGRHVTLKFGVKKEEVAHLIGKEVIVRLVESRSNDRIQAVVVELNHAEKEICGNKNPHITISMAAGVKPVESNAMLAGENKVDYHIGRTVIGKIEFFEFK